MELPNRFGFGEETGLTRNGRPTIRDVARAAGLSATTVSRALNGHDDVAEETRARIRETALALDYHPNMVARSLQNSRADAVGLIIPLVLHRLHDPFWGDFISGAAAACTERGQDLLISTADARDETSRGLQRLLRGRRVDGVLICDVRCRDLRIDWLKRHGLPFVAFGRTTGEQDYPFVDVDGTAGVALAMEHLLRLGHRRIAYLGVDPEFGFSFYRLVGYRSSLTRAGLPALPHFICERLTETTVVEAAEKLLALPERPSAIIAGTDFLALGVLAVARKNGVRIPRDLSLIVFDDTLAVRHAEPPLTAIGQPNRDLGGDAARLLLDRIAGPGAPLAQHLVLPTLTVRDSTGRPVDGVNTEM